MNCLVCSKPTYKKINSPREYRKYCSYECNKEFLINLKPWASRLRDIKQRCLNKKNASYKNYGGRGIKLNITKEQIKEIWFRDKAYLMKKPSIDRINNDGDYEYSNCQFIELKENTLKCKGRRKLFKDDVIKIKQMLENNIFQKDIAKVFNVTQETISSIKLNTPLYMKEILFEK